MSLHYVSPNRIGLCQCLTQPLPLIVGTYILRLCLTASYCSCCSNLILQLELNQSGNRCPWHLFAYPLDHYHEIRNQYYIEFNVSTPHFCGCLSCQSALNRHLPSRRSLSDIGITFKLWHCICLYSALASTVLEQSKSPRASLIYSLQLEPQFVAIIGFDDRLLTGQGPTPQLRQQLTNSIAVGQIYHLATIASSFSR